MINLPRSGLKKRRTRNFRSLVLIFSRISPIRAAKQSHSRRKERKWPESRGKAGKSDEIEIALYQVRDRRCQGMFGADALEARSQVSGQRCPPRRRMLLIRKTSPRTKLLGPVECTAPVDCSGSARKMTTAYLRTGLQELIGAREIAACVLRVLTGGSRLWQ